MKKFIEKFSLEGKKAIVTGGARGFALGWRRLFTMPVLK